MRRIRPTAITRQMIGIIRAKPTGMRTKNSKTPTMPKASRIIPILTLNTKLIIRPSIAKNNNNSNIFNHPFLIDV